MEWARFGLLVERKQGFTAELLDPVRSGLVGRSGPPRLAEIRVLSPSEIRRADGIVERGTPPLRKKVALPPRGRRWKGGYPLPPPPIYIAQGGLLQAPVVPHNRLPQARTYGNGRAKCMCC